MLEVLRPLYGIPEAGTHWFKTYHDHHTVRLGLTVSSFDPCLMFSAQAIVGLQTDDSLFSGTEDYITLEEEKRQSAGFPAKPIQRLEKGKDLCLTVQLLPKIRISYSYHSSVNAAKSHSLTPITLILKHHMFRNAPAVPISLQ